MTFAPPKGGGRATNNSIAASLETPAPGLPKPKPRTSSRTIPPITSPSAQKSPSASQSSPTLSSPSTPTNRPRPSSGTETVASRPDSKDTLSPLENAEASSTASSSGPRRRRHANPVAGTNVPSVSSPLATMTSPKDPSPKSSGPRLKTGSGSSSTPTQVSVSSLESPPGAKPIIRVPRSTIPVSANISSESTLSATPPTELPEVPSLPPQPVFSKHSVRAYFKQKYHSRNAGKDTEEELEADDEAGDETDYSPRRPTQSPYDADSDEERAPSPASRIFESVTVGMRVARGSKDTRGDSFLLVGPGPSGNGLWARGCLS
ncbi:hypothetical protein BDZ89DRAFT_1133733 [Hymenopellis radicata]|nr:hypothetical protein BDZ89DRAFT_1133733 [Hymenopellis radicata]